MRSLHRITFSRNRFNPRSARADPGCDLERSVATRNQPMSFFGTISMPALDETSTPIIRRLLHRARIACDLSGILLIPTSDQREYTNFTIAKNTMQETSNFILGCRGFRSLRA
jgi:hypothetical protein